MGQVDGPDAVLVEKKAQELGLSVGVEDSRNG